MNKRYKIVLCPNCGAYSITRNNNHYDFITSLFYMEHSSCTCNFISNKFSDLAELEMLFILYCSRSGKECSKSIKTIGKKIDEYETRFAKLKYL